MEISPDNELPVEVDFRQLSGVVRGKYAERYRQQVRVVRLAADVADSFPDEESVNSALRTYLHNHPVGGSTK